jgi:hypothetical protein
MTNSRRLRKLLNKMLSYVSLLLRFRDIEPLWRYLTSIS